MTDAELTPDMLLAAYRNGYFPMALTRDDPELFWFAPEERGVIPLDRFKIPRGLKRALPQLNYTLTINQDFDAVIRACGAKTPTRQETWINETIVDLYTALHNAGHAHSVEVWQEEGLGKDNISYASDPSPPDPHSPTPLLIGGLYGISIGGAFFGESMFSRAPEASKCALVMLVSILRECGYTLLDTQYVNDHLKQFGVVATAKKTYMTKLENALKASPNPSSRFSTASVRRGAASASSLSITSAS